MNQQVVIHHPQLGIMPVAARNTAIDSDALGAGIAGSFPVLAFKGKNWSVRYRGNDNPILLLDNMGRAIGTVPALECVILNVSPTLTKSYYKTGYVEGSFEPPDCWSFDALAPDKTVKDPQHKSCLLCRHNAFGSKASETGRRGKACQDRKRLAIVPYPDMRNERFGGPMLLSVPPASLDAIVEYADRLKASGWEWYALVTQLSFDPNEPHPQIVFREVKGLGLEEIKVVHELQADPRVDRIINKGVEFEEWTDEEFAERKASATTSAPVQGAPTVAAQPAASATLAQRPAEPAPQSPAPTAATPASAGGWGAPSQTTVTTAEKPADDLAIPSHLRREPTQPTPAAAPAAEYQYSPDGKYRWKPGMTNWEEIPAPPLPPPVGGAVPPPLPAGAAADPSVVAAEPVAPQPKRARKSRSSPVSPGPAQPAQTPPAATAAPATATPGAGNTWGGVQSNGAAGQPAPAGAPMTQDPAMAGFDEKLSQLL